MANLNPYSTSTAPTPQKAYDNAHGSASAEAGNLDQLSLASSLPKGADKSPFAAGSASASGGPAIPTDIVPTSIKTTY